MAVIGAPAVVVGQRDAAWLAVLLGEHLANTASTTAHSNPNSLTKRVGRFVALPVRRAMDFDDLNNQLQAARRDRLCQEAFDGYLGRR